MTNGTAIAEQHDRSKPVAALLALLLALSSLVFIEPAPYDLLAIVFFVGLLVSGMRLPREIHTAVALLGIFLLGNFFASIMVAEPLGTLRSLSIRVYMVLIWLLIVAVVSLHPKRMLAALWVGYIIAAVVATVWGALEYFGFIQNDLWQAGLRAKGPFKDPNVFGPFLVPAAVYSLRRLASPGAAVKFLFTGMFFALSFGILVSFSRGAWINFSIAISLYAIFALRAAPSLRARLQWLGAGTLMLVLIVALLGFAISQKTIGDRFFQRAVLTQKYDVARGGRFASQQKALKRIAGDPIGVGPGRSHDEFGLEPHNVYLHVAVEGGWLAAIGWLGFLGLTLYRSLPLFRAPEPLRHEFFVVFSSLAGVLTQSMFIDSTHWRHLWLLLALVWTLIIATQRMDSPRQPGSTT
jgi:O-antigen ligase